MALENSYYASFIFDAKECLKTNDKVQIKNYYRLLEEEISMPYIPLKYEETLHKLHKEFQNYLKEDKNIKVDFNTLVQKKVLNEEEKYQLISNLTENNLRNYLQELQEILNNNNDNILKVAILESLKNQEINCDFKVDSRVVNPINLPVVFNDNILKLIVDLEDFYFKNPQMFLIAKEILLDYYFKIYPKQVESNYLNIIKEEINNLF